jgi:hypothetical protein
VPAGPWPGMGSTIEGGARPAELVGKEVHLPFDPVDSRPSFPRLEQDVQAWWDRSGIVKKTLESGDPRHPFVFFEGPPTANGRPGVHHLEARSTKDRVLRYRRMRGQRILGARAGWDGQLGGRGSHPSKRTSQRTASLTWRKMARRSRRRPPARGSVLPVQGRPATLL